MSGLGANPPKSTYELDSFCPPTTVLGDTRAEVHARATVTMCALQEVTPDKVQEIPSKLLDKNLNTSDMLSDVTDGNIIVFQRADLATNTQFAYPTALKYLECVF